MRVCTGLIIVAGDRQREGSEVGEANVIDCGDEIGVSSVREFIVTIVVAELEVKSMKKGGRRREHLNSFCEFGIQHGFFEICMSPVRRRRN